MRRSLKSPVRVIAMAAMAVLTLLALATLYGPLGSRPANDDPVMSPGDGTSVRIILADDGRSRVIRDGLEVTDPAEKTRLLDRARLIVNGEEEDGDVSGAPGLPAGPDPSVPAVPHPASLEGTPDAAIGCCPAAGGQQSPSRL